MQNIKWGCIQPLTGGMYIGARNAIGHDAEWIISYKGLSDVKYDKAGNMKDVGNEYNLLEWFKKNNINVPYYTFEHNMFECPNPHSATVTSNVYPITSNIFNNIDIVVAVPVCSGLSKATIASSDTKNTRNCNMKFITEYTLGIIKPKAYIFENAPALFSSEAGSSMRDELNDIAKKYNYSIIYYKTDTKYHDNCQKRPRTFVIFTKTAYAPILKYEHKLAYVSEYLSRIPKDATQQDMIVSMPEENKIFMDFFVHYYGVNWREHVPSWMLQNIIDNNIWDDIYKFIDNYDCEDKYKIKLKTHLEHVYKKVSDGKNYYSMLPRVSNELHTVACMFKNIPAYLHYKEDRLYNIREWLWIMGMPHDFELYGDINVNYPKLGQNVPVRTAQWIVSEVVRSFNDNEYNNSNIAFYDNTKNG